MKIKSIRKHLTCVASLAAALALLTLNSAKAVVYWTADTSRGTSVFALENIDEPGGTITVASDPLGQYGSVYKFYLPDEPSGFGKERTESSGTETNGGEFLPAYNTGYYIGWRAMWNPMPIDPGWVALMQMHGYGVSGQGAPLVLRCVNGDGNIYLQANANGVDTNFWHMPFHTNVWQGFVEHVFLSTNPAVGYVEFWVNGVQQTFVNGQTRWYTPTWDNVDGSWQDSYNKLKWGVYRSGAMDGKGPATAYMSGATVGSTYADVDPGIGTADFSLSASPSSLTVVQGNNGTSTITVNPLNGFTGSVSLSASGLPSGVAASFNPSSTTSTSTLTLTASGTATTGTATVTVTGTSGSLIHTTTISLTVNPAPDFSLSASPSSLTVVQGNNGTSTITVNPLNGFTGSVSLSASGLPSGVTASFNPSSTTSTSTLTLTASSTATTGTATVTVTGTSGSLTHTTTISLTVNPPPDFSLSASPSSLTVVQGNNGTSTITVNPVNGFNSSVSLSASGLPSGVTASFNPSSTTSTSTLTLTASSTATTGTATVTVTGTSGSLNHTTTISLTVNPSGLPTGWTDQDIGAVNLAGSASYNSGAFTITGAGVDISGTADGFNYAYQSVSGDTTVIARVASENGSQAYAKAGPMIRETTNSGSVHASVLLTPTNGVAMEIRLTTGGTAINVVSWIHGVPLPQWARLVRSGNTFSGYYSSNAATWTLIATTNITMATNALAGLAVSAHDTNSLNTATIDSVTTFISGIYQVQNEASGLVLNNQGATTNGAPVTQWTLTSSSNLDWTFISTTNGYYQINSSKSGLDAAVAGASTANGAGIVQWAFGTTGDDLWKPVQNSDGSYTFFNLHSGLVLEDPGSSTNKTTQMDQWSTTGGSNQKWNLLKQ